jgi:hypothetical protein
VQEADRDEDGISIAANALALNGGAIRQGGAGTAGADLTHDAVAADPARRVNGSLVTRPTVSAIYLDNHVPPPSGDTYERGERVRVWVEFDRDVIVTGSPQVVLTIGSQTKQATYSGFSTATVPGGGTIVEEAVLSFDYSVQATDRDEDGISIAANALVLNGGTIKHSGDGTTDADLTHAAVADDPARKVDGSLVTHPAVKRVSLYYPARGDTYERGETVWMAVEFDRATTVVGSPQLALTVGTQTRAAAFVEVWGHLYAFFSYQVQEADRDEDGISIAANALVLNGGTIKHSGDGTTDADLTHAAVADDPARKVDGSLVTHPAVKRVSLYYPARGDTYERGETVWMAVEFDRATTVVGSPQLALTVGTQTRAAAFVEVWGHLYAFFSYQVQEADRDEDGVSIPANALNLYGGTITHAGDATVDADLSHDAVAADPGRKVDGSRVAP